MNKLIKLLVEDYNKIKDSIKKRVEEFEVLYKYKLKDRIFEELIFCLFTPQSKAVLCWDAVMRLKENDLLHSGSAVEIAENMSGVRFHNNKSRYVVLAREKFFSGKIIEKIYEIEDIMVLREWLVNNIKGYGYKEASHFLRNIGLGKKIAILDRHILKNLVKFSVIEDIPKCISKKDYYSIEDKLLRFSYDIDIQADHLDILLWYRETGEIFK